jgi:hypothetical protein
MILRHEHPDHRGWYCDDADVKEVELKNIELEAENAKYHEHVLELLVEKEQLQNELDKYKSAIIEVNRRAEIIKKAWEK